MSEVVWLNAFGDNLAEMMDEYGISQQELAEETGLTQSTISKYLNKTQMPGLKAIINISYALNCDLEDLIDFGDTID